MGDDIDIVAQRIWAGDKAHTRCPRDVVINQRNISMRIDWRGSLAQDFSSAPGPHAWRIHVAKQQLLYWLAAGIWPEQSDSRLSVVSPPEVMGLSHILAFVFPIVFTIPFSETENCFGWNRTGKGPVTLSSLTAAFMVFSSLPQVLASIDLVEKEAGRASPLRIDYITVDCLSSCHPVSQHAGYLQAYTFIRENSNLSNSPFI